MNIPVSEFFKSQLHTQVTLPVSWNRIDSATVQDYSQHNLNIFNLWLSKAELVSHHHDVADKSTPEMVRIEQKLDVIINLVQQMLCQQTDNNLSLSTVLIGVAGMSWFTSDQQLNVGQLLSISLSLDTSQSPVCLYSNVISIDHYDGNILCTAKFTAQNERVNELMEKWIFNLHRHEIANLRQK